MTGNELPRSKGERSASLIIIIIIRAFVRRTMSASELNLRRRSSTLPVNVLLYSQGIYIFTHIYILKVAYILSNSKSAVTP